MRFTERVYLNSPIWVQQIMVACFGWWWYRRRFKGNFTSFLSDFRKRDRWSAEQFQKYQEEQLKAVFKKAFSSQYYRNMFSEIQIEPTENVFDQLKRIPILSKDIIRTRAKELLTGNLPRNTTSYKSSGTTGTPTEIFYTRDFHALTQALFTARNLEWAGVSYRDRRVMFGVRKVCRFDQKKPPFWRYSPVENMAYASIYHLSPKFLPYYLDFLRKYNPTLIMGYPSSLHTIARYALEHNDFPAPAKAVITTSETVTDQIRETVETAWQCKIFDQYCSVEDCFFAAQCEFGKYHVSPEMGIIEIVDSAGQPVERGKIGEIICTGLQNFLQPLIRYRIGDIARWATDQTCKCGRQMPILEGVEGRFEDICLISDGREILRFDTVFKGVDNILEAQVIQEELNQFIIKIVPSVDFGQKDITRLENNMRLHTGDAQILVKTVQNIPRSASGKFKAVICNMSSEQKKKIREANFNNSFLRSKTHQINKNKL